jgi:hypothetical protein
VCSGTFRLVEENFGELRLLPRITLETIIELTNETGDRFGRACGGAENLLRCRCERGARELWVEIELPRRLPSPDRLRRAVFLSTAIRFNA